MQGGSIGPPSWGRRISQSADYSHFNHQARPGTVVYPPSGAVSIPVPPPLKNELLHVEVCRLRIQLILLRGARGNGALRRRHDGRAEVLRADAASEVVEVDLADKLAVPPSILEEEAGAATFHSHTDEEHRMLPDVPAIGGSGAHKFSAFSAAICPGR